jgi:hypothetical protein
MDTPIIPRFRWYREPAVHFLLIGLALFLIHSRIQKGAREDDRKVVMIDASELDAWRADFRRKFNRSPNPKEDSLLLAENAQDEILFRKALDMGLDEGDEIIRRRLILKMEFFMDDIPGLDPPSDGELEAFLKANPVRYGIPAQAAFTHLFFSASKHGPRTGEHAARILTRLRKGELTPEAAADQADPYIVETPEGATSESEIAKSFGPEFARRLFATDTGSWQGPIPSPYGQHLVRIRDRRKAGTMNFAEAKPKLVSDLSELKKARARYDFLAGLRREYTVELRRQEPRFDAAGRVYGDSP